MKSDLIRLRHILKAAHDIVRFTKGKTRKDIKTDEILVLALIKEIEIIGEAATKLSIETKEKFPNVEWRDIIGMRNRLIHAYDEIDFGILCDTIVNDIPQLIKELEQIPELRS